jgi:hypothetical protein
MKTSGNWKQPVWVVGVAILLLAGGCGSHVAQVKAPPPMPKYPWFDAKNICVFRLGDGPMPQTADELSKAMERGWSRAISFPDPNAVVAVERAAFPSIGALRVNLSDGRFRTGAKNSEEIDLNNRVERVVRVGTLEVRADPLLVRSARMYLNVYVQGAKMALERDSTGRPVMMLQDAMAGTLSLEVSVADLEALMLRDSRESLARFGVNVDDVRLNVVAETPRSVQVTLHMAMDVGFVPAGITFKVHLSVDDAMNATVTDMTLEGDDVMGPLIALFMRPVLVKHNNETRQLVSFPAGKIRLRDVSFRTGDSLRMDAAFGS